MNNLLAEAKKYKELNKYAEKGQIVVFGDGCLVQFPFYDLMQGRVSDYALYNRSLELMTIKESIEVVDHCPYHLSPRAVLLHFENNEAEETFKTDYYRLIEKIRSLDKKCRICLLDDSGQRETVVQKIAERTKTGYLSIPTGSDEQSAFHLMDAFFRGGKISFWDAFAI